MLQATSEEETQPAEDTSNQDTSETVVSDAYNQFAPYPVPANAEEDEEDFENILTAVAQLTPSKAGGVLPEGAAMIANVYQQAAISQEATTQPCDGTDAHVTDAGHGYAVSDGFQEVNRLAESASMKTTVQQADLYPPSTDQAVADTTAAYPGDAPNDDGAQQYEQHPIAADSQYYNGPYYTEGDSSEQSQPQPDGYDESQQNGYDQQADYSQANNGYSQEYSQ